jgi:hypothetical protein
LFFHGDVFLQKYVFKKSVNTIKKQTAETVVGAPTFRISGIERSIRNFFSKTGGAGQHPHETSTPQFNRMKYTNTGTKLSAGMQGNKSN